MKYYAHVDSKNKLIDIDLALIESDSYGSKNVKNIDVTENIYKNAKKYGLAYYTYSGGKIIKNPNYEAEKQAEEKERINNLTMTPLDFIKILESLGLNIQQINAFLESHLDIKMQLTYCNSVYCGVVKSFLPIEIEGVTITVEMVERAFKAKEQ